MAFKVRVPDSSAATLRSIKPGEWVRVTSPHRPSGEADAVMAVRPYVESANQPTTTN